MGTDNANKDRQAIDLLFAERCSCVVRNGDTIRIFRERGVRDLWRLLHEEPELLDGAFVADKVKKTQKSSVKPPLRCGIRLKESR